MTTHLSPAQDLRADLLADLAGPSLLPGAEPLGREPAPAVVPAQRERLPRETRERPTAPPALELRVTPTRWRLRLRETGLQVGPLSVALTR